MPVKSLYWMELESQSQQFTQSPWSDRAAQIVKPSDLCHVHVESIPFSSYGLLPWPSDCQQVACIQGKYPRALQSRRGVHLATGSEGSKYTTWCPSNEAIQQFSSCHLACIRQLNMAVVISPCGSCCRVFYAICCNFMLSMYELWRPSVWVEAFCMGWGVTSCCRGWISMSLGRLQHRLLPRRLKTLSDLLGHPTSKEILNSLTTSWRGISFMVQLDELCCDFN